MTIINPKSITGVTSITTASGADNLLTVHTNNTTERVRINNDGDVIVGSGITVSPDGDIFTTGVTTATTFVGALTGNVTGNITGNISGGTVAGSTGTFTGDVDIADKIVHTGDTNTAIRFPAADTITAETGGSERLRIDSSGRVLIGTTTEGEANADNLTIAGSAHVGITIRAGTTSQSAIYMSDATSGGGEYAGNIIYDHNDNHMRFATAETERIRITSGGDVGIGDNNPSIRLTVVDSGTENLVRLGRSDGSGHGSHTVNIKTSKDFYHNFKMEASSYDLDCYNGSSMIDALSIDTNGQVVVQSGDLRFGSAGSGIVLGNTSNADANTLDDYEEGTWTPVWSDATSGGTTSSSAQMHGHYTKIGRMVTVHFYTWGLPSQGTTNAIILQGLPFTAGVIGEVVGAVQAGYYNDGNTSTYNLVIKVTTGNTYGRLEWNSAGNNDVVPASFSGFINNYTNFTATLTYLTTS